MTLTLARSSKAREALALVTRLQEQFASVLDGISSQTSSKETLELVEWLRDAGRHGGGTRLCIADSEVFNRASVNVSQVHYDDLEQKKFGSATALSAIVHPQNPFAPSIHLHISWTEYKTGLGYWRVMADLNPAIEDAPASSRFEQALRGAAPDQYERAQAEGERYFAIPALGRHRGVLHFYLEGYQTDDAEADTRLAERVASAAIDVYGELVRESLKAHPSPGDQDRARQIAYHTLYLFQVLTLDRGTTAGLLVHDQNDLGVLGSLPGRVDPDLLASWQDKVPAPQGELVAALLEVLGQQNPAVVNDTMKAGLAQAVRQHYRNHPAALELQASALVRPPTVENHK